LKRVEVAAAVIRNARGEFLLAQRPAGKVYAGWWEFPGGKVETGESVTAALARELHEELGIDATEIDPWLTRDFDYPHAAVRLRFCQVRAWTGDLHGREGQAYAWQQPGAVAVEPVLPANGPILRALELPPVYGITHAGETGRAAFLARLEHALAGGLRLVQIREKALAPAALRAFAGEVIARARACSARVLVNGTPQLALALGADGVHLSAAELMRCHERPALAWCAASCHDAAELAHAAKLGLDFVVLGSVLPTMSHPGGPTLGWERFAALVADTPLPVFALGGLAPVDIAPAWRCGAHGIAMMRGAWPD
jgi:8-oxo-dGTP diphosphatase